MPRGPSPKMDDVAVRVASGQKLAHAARAAGVSESTAKGWSSRPDFKGKVDAVRAGFMSRSVDRLAAAGTRAVATLVELTKPGHEDAIRLRAAGELLSHLIVVREHVELAGRLESIEASMVQGRQHWG